MLDTFRKRDNLRPATPAQPGVRTTLGGAHTPSPAAGPVRADSAPVKPVLLDPPAPPVAAPAAAAPSVPVDTVDVPLEATNDVPTSSARLIVGPEIKLKGAEITDCDTLMVEGEVDASMDSRVVEIAEQGVFRGKVQVDIAEIRGRFEGELTAHKRLVIRDTGRVSGKIRYGKVCIDEGGELSGDIAAIAVAGAHGGAASRVLESRGARESVPAAAATSHAGPTK